jgi:hypothetical protein
MAMSSSHSSLVNVTLYFIIAVFCDKNINIIRQYQVDMTLVYVINKLVEISISTQKLKNKHFLNREEL